MRDQGISQERSVVTSRTLLFIVTALVEAATGLGLLVLPAVVFDLLLGLKEAAGEALFVGRIAGAALLAIGVASWLTRRDESGPAQPGLLAGIAIYNAATTALLSYAAAALEMTGPLLWPAVAIHAGLTVWCVTLLRAGTAKEPPAF
jgi:hypothetical protein